VKNLFYICNALDDATRLERGITTDSPAASRKVFLLSKALSSAGVRVVVISLGRGKQDGSRRYFRGTVRRVGGIPVIYLPFFHFPVLSELLSLFSIAPVLWRMRSRRGERAAIFYNRLPAYLFGLIQARVLRFRTILDLEDGEIKTREWSLGAVKSKVINWIFDVFCTSGALLACTALESMTKLQPTICCYGTCEVDAKTRAPSMFPVSVLFGGTVSTDTGAQLLIDTIKILMNESPAWAARIQFEISGKGDCMQKFKSLAEDDRVPRVIMHGRTTDDEYREVLARTQVGLALKPNSGALADTTFPSKVIEFASHGVLVFTTDISDVRKIFSDGAIYLTNDDPRTLIDKLRWVVEHRQEANDLALIGQKAVAASCEPTIVGKMLEQFIFKN